MSSDKFIKEIQQKYRRLRVAKFRKKLKQRAVEYKGGKCNDCGYNKSLKALQFHHSDPNIKDFTISSPDSAEWGIIKKELDKCILLCANCHMERHEKEIEEQYLLFQKEIDDFKKDQINQRNNGISLKCNFCNKYFSKLEFKTIRIDLVFCSKKCSKNYHSINIAWPSIEDMQNLVNSKPLTEIANNLKISCKRLYKFCKDNEIKLLPKFYWSKHQPKTRISWPSNEELQKLVFEKPLIHLAAELGVSDVAVKKRCKTRNIKLPKRGFWLKKKWD